MARKLRVQYPGPAHRVINLGDQGEIIFRDDQDREQFLATLRRLFPTRLVANARGLVLALFAALLIGGCVTEPEGPSHLRVGMTPNDLVFLYGQPLRIEATENGGQVWYYHVVTPDGPQVEGTGWADNFTGAGGVGVAVSPAEKVRVECPIFLSPEGRVVEPVPIATIRGR